MGSQILTAELAASSKVSTLDHDIRVHRTKLYPQEVWYFFSCLIALVAVCQLLSYLFAKFFKRSAVRARSSDAEKSTNTALSSNTQFGLRNVPSAIVNFYRIVAFRLTINIGSFSLNLAEVILTLMYMAALFIWTFINTKNLSGQMDPKYWNNRAGTIATAQLPLITVLGTKNNIISWITGVSYEKLNYLHRMCARVVFVLLWVHAGARIKSGVSKDIGEAWYQLGCMALGALALLCVVSLRPVRGRAYELFFYLHLITVLLFLIGSYYHTKEYAFETYVWPSFVVWGFDRAVRILRVFVFNHLYFAFWSKSKSLDATVELLTPHLVRMTMKRPRHFHWSPGQVAYLITPQVSLLPFEAHPFTIASYNSSMSRKEITFDYLSSAPSPKDSKEEIEESPLSYWKEVVFLINVREGFTKRLADIAAKQETVKVYLDGPYGFSSNVSMYDTIVFVAGGSGVSHTLPLFLETIEKVRSGKSSCQRATFIWSIRDARHVKWISDALYSALLLVPESLKVQIQIFVTGSDIPTESSEWDAESLHSGSTAADSSSESKTRGAPSLLSLPSVNLSQGRPPLSTLLAEEAEETRGGSMLVSVCGSHSIASAVRQGLGFSVAGPATILKGGASVTLHIESFGYA